MKAMCCLEYSIIRYEIIIIRLVYEVVLRNIDNLWIISILDLLMKIMEIFLPITNEIYDIFDNVILWIISIEIPLIPDQWFEIIDN